MCSLRSSSVQNRKWNYYATYVKVTHIFFSQDLAVETETSQLLTHQSFLLEQSRRTGTYIRVTLYSEAVFYSCTVQLIYRGRGVQCSYSEHLLLTAILYTCTVVAYSCSVKLYTASVLYSCTPQLFCTAVQCSCSVQQHSQSFRI
jgi:hypothetical protein